ncbi:hypothetical protein DICA0_E36906 [Diutina catenulata]
MASYTVSVPFDAQRWKRRTTNYQNFGTRLTEEVLSFEPWWVELVSHFPRDLQVCANTVLVAARDRLRGDSGRPLWVAPFNVVLEGLPEDQHAKIYREMSVIFRLAMQSSTSVPWTLPIDLCVAITQLVKHYLVPNLADFVYFVKTQTRSPYDHRVTQHTQQFYRGLELTNRWSRYSNTELVLATSLVRLSENQIWGLRKHFRGQSPSYRELESWSRRFDDCSGPE